MYPKGYFLCAALWPTDANESEHDDVGQGSLREW